MIVSGSREPRSDHELGPIVKQGSSNSLAMAANSETTANAAAGRGVPHTIAQRACKTAPACSRMDHVDDLELEVTSGRSAWPNY
jgi:hypothetical protein